MTSVPASDSSGLAVILSGVLAGIGDTVVLAASATLSPQSLCGEAVLLPPSSRTLTCNVRAQCSSQSNPCSFVSPARRWTHSLSHPSLSSPEHRGALRDLQQDLVPSVSAQILCIVSKSCLRAGISPAQGTLFL